MSTIPTTSYPAADLPLTAPGQTDSLIGVDEATRRLCRFPLSQLPVPATMEAALDGMQDQVDQLNAGRKGYPTWADAVAAADAVGTIVEIIGDEGTHTDPVSGETVSNSGRFVMTSGGLEWRSADALASKANQSDLDVVSESKADQSYLDGLLRPAAAARHEAAITDDYGNALIVFSDAEIEHPVIQQLQEDAPTAAGKLIHVGGASRLAVTDEAGNACAVFDTENPGNGGTGSTPESDYVIAPETWSYGDSDAWSREDDLAQTAYIFVSFGQSNAIGTNNDTDSVISSEATYPENALMPGAVRVTSGGQSLVPLVESGTGSVKETVVSAAVNHFIREHDTTFGVRPTIVGFAAGVGGAPMMALKRGSEGYGYFLAGLTDALAGLKELGFRKFITVVNWIGSEGDADKFWGMTASRYCKQAKAFFRQLQQDVMERTGETVPPLIVLQPIAYNPDSLHGSVPLPAGGVQALNLWDAPVLRGMALLDGVDNIRVAPPAYAYPHSTASGDGLHRNCAGHYQCGVNLAKVAWAELIGTGWRGCRPSITEKPYWSSATELIVPFDTQGGGPATSGGDDGTVLVLDTSGDHVTPLTNHGLEFDDGSGSPPSITSVSVSGKNLVVTLASAPTGPRKRLFGGLTPSTAGGVGPVTGPRTTIRDAYGWSPIHASASATPIYDFSLPFALEV
jgi:hypothetical protein